MKLFKWLCDRFDMVLGAKNEIRAQGMVKIEHIRGGEKIGEYLFPNGITDEGLNHILNTQFHNTTQVATWYIGLIDNSGFSALAAGDTAAQINGTNGWDELSEYDEATRPAWTEGAAASRSITNAATVDFTINATKTVKGIFLVSTNTIDGTTGFLWATAAFGSTVSVVDNDVLKVTYTVSG
jgi:hypothetical protein